MAGKVDNSLVKSGTNVDVCLESELTSGGGLTPSCEMTPSDVFEEKKCLLPSDNSPGLLPRLFGSVADSIAKGAKEADKAEKSFKELPNLNEFRFLWPKGGLFDENPLKLNYGGNAARFFGQTGIAKELAHIKKTEPERYAAIEEYFARYQEIERFFKDANSSKNVNLEYIEFGIERLKELAKQADLEALYKSAIAREQDIYWEYKAGQTQYALKALAVTSSEEISGYEVDKRALLLEIALKLKAGIPYESDIPPRLGNKERVLQELNGLNVEKELDNLIAELKNDSGESARSGVTTDEILDYNERLTACAGKLAEFHSFYGRFEKSSASYGYPQEVLSRIEGTALYARERVKNAFKRNGINGLAEEFGNQAGDILAENMNERLLNGGSAVKIGADIVKHSAKRKDAVSKGYSEGLSNEDLLEILKGLDADTQALDRILEAAENLKKEAGLYQVGEKGLLYHSRRSELYTAMSDQMAPVEKIIAGLMDGSKSWGDLSELERSDLLEALARANTITANQGIVVFNNGASRLSTGNGKLARLCARNRIGIGDASEWGTRDLIDDLARKGEAEWAKYDGDIDNIAWRIERFEKQLRIARLEDSIEGEQKFLDSSKGAAENAAKYPVLFGQIDLEKHGLIGAINEYSSLPYIKWAEGEAADFKHRLSQIMAKDFDENEISALERDIGRHLISGERYGLGWLLNKDNEYLKYRAEVWFYESLIDITLAGWVSGGIAGWVANSAKGLGAGEAAAHMFKLVPEGLLFHAGTRSFGHEGWHGYLSESEGFARSIAMLGYIGAVGKPVRAVQMERIQEMAIANVQKQAAAGAVKAATKELIAAEVKRLSEDMFLRTAHSAEWFAFEYPAFQGFSAGWDLGGNLATVISGEKVTQETWFGRHIFEGSSWKEGFKTLVGLRLGGAARSEVQKVLEKGLSEIRAVVEQVESAPVLINEEISPQDETPTAVAVTPLRVRSIEGETPVTAKDELSESKTPETWAGGDGTTPGILIKSDEAKEIDVQQEQPPMPFTIIHGLRANYNFIIWVRQGDISYTLDSSTNTIRFEMRDVEKARMLLNPARPAWDDNMIRRFIGEPREVATEDGLATFVTLRTDDIGNPILMEIFSPQQLASRSGYKVEIDMPAEAGKFAEGAGEIEEIGDGRILLVIEGEMKGNGRIPVLDVKNIPAAAPKIEPEVEAEAPFFDTPPKSETVAGRFGLQAHPEPFGAPEQGLKPGRYEARPTYDEWAGGPEGSVGRNGRFGSGRIPGDPGGREFGAPVDVESGALKENKHRYILSRGEEIEKALIDTGMDEIAAHDLAETVAAMEFRNPEWRGKLKLGDFVDGQFAPTEERKLLLAKLSDDSLEDLFPEYDVHPGMPDALAKLTQFMDNYRRAERHYDSPSLKDVHCFRSASRVLMLLRSKGFDAHILNTSKDLSDGRTINHVVVLAEIDGIKYAIDINHQQFGPKNDRLIIMPRNEIGKIGLREKADQLGIDHDTVDFAAKADQKAIRKYMQIMGLMPEPEAGKPSTEPPRAPYAAAETVSGADEKDYDEERQVTYEDNGLCHFDPEQGLFDGSKKLNTTTIRKIGDDIYIVVRENGHPTAWQVGEGGKAKRVNYGFYYDLEKRPEIMVGDKKVPVKILEKSGEVYLVEAEGIGLMAWQEEPLGTMESSAETMRHYFPKTGKMYIKGKNETAGRLIDAKVVEGRVIDDDRSIRLLKDAGSNKLTAWLEIPKHNILTQLHSVFFPQGERSGKLFSNGSLSEAEIAGHYGDAYLLRRSGASKLTCWLENPFNGAWTETDAYFIAELGKVFSNGRLLEAKVVERVGDNVLIDAKKYDGPVAWTIFEGDINLLAENVYFGQSQKLATVGGRVRGVRTLFRDGDVYLLEDQKQFAVRINPATGEIYREVEHFFKTPGAEYGGVYFSQETGVTASIVVDGDLFSVKNRQAFEALEADAGKLKFVMVDSDGQVLQNKIYPDLRDKSTFWVTNVLGHAKKVTANQIGDSPFYIFNIPQEIKKHETIYDGSGSAFNVSVWKRDGSETREATQAEVKELARGHIGNNAPELTRLSDVAVVGESVPINAKGLKRIKNGFSWKVKVAGAGMERTIEVKIEAVSEEEAKATLDDLQETFGKMPAALFKTVNIVEIYKENSTKYGFTKKERVGGYYRYRSGKGICSVFEVSGKLNKWAKDVLAHELNHSLSNDQDRENVLLAIAADGLFAGDQLNRARDSRYHETAWYERVAEFGAAAAMAVFGGEPLKVFEDSPSIASALAYIWGRPASEIGGNKNEVVSNPPAASERRASQPEFELVTVANGRGSRNVEIKDVDGDEGEGGFQVVLIDGKESFFVDGQTLTVYDDCPRVEIIRRVDGHLQTIATHNTGDAAASYELQGGDRILVNGGIFINFNRVEEPENINWDSIPNAKPSRAADQLSDIQVPTVPLVVKKDFLPEAQAVERDRLEQELAAQVSVIDKIITNFTPAQRDKLLRLIDDAFKTIDGLERLGVKSKVLLKLGLLGMKREFSQVSEPQVTKIDVPADTFNGSKNRIVFGRAMPEGSANQPDIALGDSSDEFRDISRKQLVFERTDEGWNVRRVDTRYQAKIGFADIDTYKTFDVEADPILIPPGRYEIAVKTDDNVILLKVVIPPAEPMVQAVEDGRLQQLRAAASNMDIDFYQFMDDLYGKEFQEAAGVSINEAKFSIMFMTSDWQYIKGRLSKKFPGLPELIEQYEEGGARVNGNPNPPSLTLDGETYHFTLQFLPEIRIGRSQAADISIDDPLASKNHAKIIRKDEKYYVVDENSSNGIFIQRGERVLAIKKGRSAELLDGDVILIGRKSMAVSLPFQRLKQDAPAEHDRSGEIIDVGPVDIEGAYPRVEEAEPPEIDPDADPIMSKSMVVPVGSISERPIASEPVEIFVRGQGRLKAGKYVGSVERVLDGEEWKFRFTDEAGASRIIDPKDIVAISRRNGSESNRKLNQQFVRSPEPQFKQGACNISRKGKMIIVDFRDKRLTKFLEERIRPVYDKLIAGKINREKAAREAWAVVSKFTDYDYAHADKGIPNYLYSLGEFVDKGVCNERGMLLQVALQYLGVSSVMEKGRFIGGRHAWVRLTDSETRELVLDPQYDKPLSPDDNLFYDYKDDGTPFDLEGVKTGVIGLR